MKVFIMGMHRSGTSMITGALKLCGLYVGSNLLMNAKDNPKGHFEEKRFLNLNNQLLIKNGGSWHKPPASISYQGLRPAMIQFLSRPEWRGADHVGWKDPRICLTFPLWHALIQPEEIRVVMIQRKIEHIAASLMKRNGFSKYKAFSLARYYRQNAYANIHRDGVSHFVTNFETYFGKGWLAELEAVCEFIRLPKPRGCLEAVFQFIEPKLNHHKGAP